MTGTIETPLVKAAAEEKKKKPTLADLECRMREAEKAENPHTVPTISDAVFYLAFLEKEVDGSRVLRLMKQAMQVAETAEHVSAARAIGWTVAKLISTGKLECESAFVVIERAMKVAEKVRDANVARDISENVVQLVGAEKVNAPLALSFMDRAMQVVEQVGGIDAAKDISEDARWLALSGKANGPQVLPFMARAMNVAKEAGDIDAARQIRSNIIDLVDVRKITIGQVAGKLAEPAVAGRLVASARGNGDAFVADIRDRLAGIYNVAAACFGADAAQAYFKAEANRDVATLPVVAPGLGT